MAPVGAAGQTEEENKKDRPKEDRRDYFVQRRQQLRTRALETVASQNNRPVECFRCGKTLEEAEGKLELDHLYYAKDSVKYGHSEQRAEEAIKFPSRFVLTCRDCHIKLDLKRISPYGLRARAEIGSENRARAALMKSRTLGQLKTERDEAVKIADAVLSSFEKAKKEWEEERQEMLDRLDEEGIGL